MTVFKQWRGLSALIEDAVEHGSRAVERVHLATARRPFYILERMPGIAAPTRVVHSIHDVAVLSTYGSIRMVNHALGQLLGLTFDVLEARAASRTGDRALSPPKPSAAVPRDEPG
jgi:hypothetical protein